MIRWSINAVLLVLALGVTAVGFISYDHSVPGDTILITQAPGQSPFRVAVVNGLVHLVHVEPAGSEIVPNADAGIGPFYVRRVRVGSVLARGIGFPFWVPAIMLVILPAMSIVRGPIRRRVRRRRGRCPPCGYDLSGARGNGGVVICPECGTAQAVRESGRGIMIRSR